MSSRISAQISLYALGQPSSSPAIDAVCAKLRDNGVTLETGPMSTLATGTAGEIFGALGAGFDAIAPTGRHVMVVTVSNACPVQKREGFQ